MVELEPNLQTNKSESMKWRMLIDAAIYQLKQLKQITIVRVTHTH